MCSQIRKLIFLSVGESYEIAIRLFINTLPLYVHARICVCVMVENRYREVYGAHGFGK